MFITGAADFNNKNSRNINFKGQGAGRMLTKLANPDSLASAVLLEGFVTGGRGYNAYKRGGKDEFRERFIDDIVSAVFWMKGADMFNKLGDKFGEKVLKLPCLNFDTGFDALRTPFENLKKDINLKNTGAAAEKIIKKLETFKFAKIITSSILSALLIGFIMPKINQKITALIMEKRKKNNENTAGNKSAFQPEMLSIEEFAAHKKGGIKSFKGLAGAAHILENNAVCKMITADAGTITGRTLTARNRDEGLEYLFRDTSSMFFYFGCTPLVYKTLQKISGTSDITMLDPSAAKTLHNHLSEQLKNNEGRYISMSAAEFEKKTLGVLDNSAEEILKKLPFKSDVISLNEFNKYVKDETLLKKAFEMTKLQPVQAGGIRVLTRQQAEDVFKSGTVNLPEFMMKIFKEHFGGKLTDPYRYISMKKIVKFRDNIDKYVQSIKVYADKTNGGTVDIELLNKLNKKSFALSAGFRIAGLAASAYALGFAIPKLQYMMTERRTGSKKAPGLRDYTA